MGRQKGDPNRSKSRPSSSSAAASLVQNTKTSVAGFGGYIGSSRIDTIDTPDKETVLDLDGEAALHLRRLSKKDPITRVKALKALDTLFKEHPVNGLCQLLPNWIFEYRKLVQDESPQVREATHIAMSSLAVSVGRGMAPHLRSVMGAWWVSQFDPAKEVSAAAQQSFQAAFQGAAKRLEALMFCASDIFSYIDGLLRLSPQTISERSAPVEELTKKYEQVVSSALLALAALVDVVLAKKEGISSTASSNEATASEKNKDKIKEIEDMTVELSENHKYFKDFVKSKSSQIRCASYQMVRAFAQNVPIVFTGDGLDIISSIALGSFSEKEPSCHQAMWDMVLLVSQKYPEAWATASIRKVVLPRLWNFLRHATYGSAQTSYPCLLPLLSLLPVHTISPTTKFLTEFFSSLWEGHTARCMAMEDKFALLKAIQECVCWIINHAERYVEKEEISAEQLQAFMVENIVLKILWKGYVFAGRDSRPNKLRDLSGACKESTVSQTGQEHLDDHTMARRLPGSSGLSQGLLSEQVCDTLRMCIIDVLATIAGKNMNLISDFWNLFQDICLEGIICDSRFMEEASVLNVGCTHRIYSFFCNLNKLLVSDEVRTTLIQPLRILVARLYILMKSVEFSECIQLIAKIVSVFRPLLFPAVEIYQIQKGESCSLQNSYEDENVISAVFSFFECDLVPWCLDGNVESSSAKIELLLSFFEDERFLKEWEFVLSYVTQLGDKSNGDNNLDVKRVTVLASFVEKLRCKLCDLCKGYSAGNNGSDPVKLWNLSKLEAAAVALAQSVSLSHPSSLQLLRCLLRGSKERSFPMMSTATVVQVTTILLQRVLQVLLKTGKTWAQYAASSLLKPDVTLPLRDFKEDNILNDLGYAAVEALGESISCLHCIDGQSDIVPKVLASLYCIAWAHSCRSKSDLPDLNNLGPLNDGIAKLRIVTDYEVEQRPPSEDGEEESDEEVSLMTDTATHVTEAPHMSGLDVFHILNRDFCRGLSADTRNVIQHILAQCVRNAILEESIDASQMVYFCAKWVVNLIDQICIDFEERDEFMSLLLQPNDCWPLFTDVPARVDEPPTIQHYWKREGIQADKHILFVAFVAKLSSFTGWENLILYSTDQDAKSNEAEGQGRERESRKLTRIWLVIELLCSWQWPGGSAGDSVIPFLISCSAHSRGTVFETILDVVMKCLLSGVLWRNYVMEFTNKFWMGLMEDMDEIGDPCLRALLVLLKKILQASSPDEMINHVERFFHALVSHKYLSDSLCNEKANTLPFILSAFIPVIRKQKVSSHTGLSLPLEAAVCRWLSAALSGPPSTAYSASDWQHGLWIAISCFPLHPAGGSVAIIAASSACTSLHEKELLLALFRKEISTDAVSGYVSHTAKQQALLLENTVDGKDLRQAHQETLAKLVAATIAYCWKELDVDDWSHVINHMRIWLEAALYEAEQFTKLIADCIDATDSEVQGDFQGLEPIDRVKLLVTRTESWQTELSWTAVCIFSLLHAIEKLGEDSSESSHCLPADWWKAKQRTLNYILRIFFSNGMAESVAMDSPAGHEAAMLIADARIANNHFWENVSEIVLSASDEEKTEAARYINIWTVGKDSIRSLYALLFSPHPIGELQLAAYCLLTHSPFKQSAVTYDEFSLQQDQSEEETLHLGTEESSLSQLAKIRPELAAVLEMSPLKIYDSSFTSSLRVQYLLAWAIFLTHLHSITVSSSAGEKLVQYIQDTNISSMFLDILFQHVSLNLESGSHGKRKATLGLRKSEAGKVEQSARRAAASGSVVFAVEGLWPLDMETTSILAAALYGIMLRVLPACVRDWFAGLRDRAMVSSVEAFTTNHCSPQLLADEFTQVHRATVADEALTIRANQSIGEVTVVYKKEEAGMDMVIRMPKCYPLRPVDVECTRRLGISETRLRKWMLSMAAFLRNQNGAVAEAIQIWKRNVDREFEGVEECPICYSIIHTVNHSLPRLACKTCRHKFHAACLYKWFSTSHKSTCPLCQTPF